MSSSKQVPHLSHLYKSRPSNMTESLHQSPGGPKKAPFKAPRREEANLAQASFFTGLRIHGARSVQN